VRSSVIVLLQQIKTISPKRIIFFSYTIIDAEIIHGCKKYGVEIGTPERGLKVICDQKVDKIEEHLATLRRSEECNKAQVQTMYFMVRLCITSA
jgi:hypothetical protein